MHYVDAQNSLKSDCLHFFCDKGYCIEPAVALNSKIDPSVFIVGSCTNVFKSHLLNQTIADGGHVLIQPALNSKFLPDFTNNTLGRYSSCYTTIGLLHNLKDLQNIITDQYDFFIKIVKLNENDLSISANIQDKDFVQILKSQKYNINIIDGEAFRNKFGQCGDFLLTGRNIRFYYKGNNICVLSVYQNNNTDLAIESSSTIHVLLMEKNALPNTMSVSILNDFHIATNNCELKYYDCISAVAELLYSGIQPNSSHMDGRILKKYIKKITEVNDSMDKKIRNYTDLINFYIDSAYPEHCMNVKSVVQKAFEKCR